MSATSSGCIGHDQLQKIEPGKTSTKAHQCPICAHIMLPPHHNPFMVFPCGHTLCSNCCHPTLCRICGNPSKTSAPNISLTLLIHSLQHDSSEVGESVQDQQAHHLDSGEISHQIEGASVSQSAELHRFAPSNHCNKRISLSQRERNMAS
jgi:hypothetical protein